MRALFTLVEKEVMRFLEVWRNTVVPALVSSLLYLIIFGVALGGRISQGETSEYLAFLIPGLIMMNVITGSYSNPSGSLYMARLLEFIKDLLLSPMKYSNMVIGFVAGGLVRGVILGIGTWLISMIFLPIIPLHPLMLLLYFLLTGTTFACIGIIIGLWAERHDQLNLLLNFVITPLVFLGGVFYSIEAIPLALQKFTMYNPIFYMVNGLRYSMTGVQEANIYIGLLILGILSIALFTICVQLFKRGWHLRT